MHTQYSCNVCVCVCVCVAACGLTKFRHQHSNRATFCCSRLCPACSLERAMDPFDGSDDDAPLTPFAKKVARTLKRYLSHYCTCELNV